MLEGTAEPEIKEALRVATSEAVERRVSGAPTFFVEAALDRGLKDRGR